MSFVYFIQSGRGGPIKIGVATNIAKRLKTLQIGNPERLAVVASLPGGQDLERELHTRFAAGQIADEWFARSTPGLMPTIEHILRHDALPPPPGPADVVGARCANCAWPAEAELADRGIEICYRCLVEQS